jgi:xanthine/uracil/vitamin C permease (AzgA family)
MTAEDRVSGALEAPPRPATHRRRRTWVFDLRALIGALFGVYGVIITATGYFASSAEIAKAAGININLWSGLGMLATCVVFLGWMFLRPLASPDEADRSGR